MEDTWASGAVELLRHADGHAKRETAFDRRIAFVSVDNAVELVMRAFLVMPRRTRGSKGPSPEEYAAVEDYFGGVLDLTIKYAPHAFARVPPLDIEHYHRIRNTLYHEGTGLTVSAEYVGQYFVLCRNLLKDLLAVEFTPAVDRLSRLRPEIREKLRAEVLAARKAKHSDAIRKGLTRAKARGLVRGRGRSPGALTGDEVDLIVSLFSEKKWGYPKIAKELTRRRRQRGSPRAADGTVIEVAPHKVRRKLKELGLVKTGGASYL